MKRSCRLGPGTYAYWFMSDSIAVAGLSQHPEYSGLEWVRVTAHGVMLEGNSNEDVRLVTFHMRPYLTVEQIQRAIDRCDRQRWGLE